MSQPMPPSAVEWNHFFNLTAIIALVALSVVVAAMVYFTIRFRERKGHPSYALENGSSRNRAREAIIFALISIIILFSVTVAGERLTPNARFQPAASESYVIQVTALQWTFEFTYPNGAFARGYLNVPANTTIMFNVTSLDVMHNFFLVQYYVSIDAVPGRYNVIWITTPAVSDNSTLSYEVVCKELCGYGHTTMRVPMTVMSKDTFNQWVTSQSTNKTAAGGG